MYYPCSENKDADQLRGYREADLRFCFRPCKLLVFSRTGSFHLLLKNNFLSESESGVEKRVSEPEPTLKAPSVDSKYSVQALSLLAEVYIRAQLFKINDIVS